MVGFGVAKSSWLVSVADTRRDHGLRYASEATTYPDREELMLLSTAKIEDFDRFVKTFSTRGAEKRKQYGCRGSNVFRDPNEEDRVWAIFDWDLVGWQKFVADPAVPAIFAEAGLKGKPQAAEFVGHYDG